MLYLLFLFLSFCPTFSQREPRFPLNPREPRFPLNPSFNFAQKVEGDFGPTSREPRFPLNPSFNFAQKVEGDFGPTLREPRFPLNPSFNFAKKVEEDFGPTLREPRFPLNPSLKFAKKVEGDFGPTFSQKVEKDFGPTFSQKVEGDFGPTFSQKVEGDFGPTFSQKVECLNEKGNPVDYWVIIKKPQGTDYFYYDSADKVFETSPYSLNDTTKGALTYTLKQLWQKDINYVIYNDQIPKMDKYYNDTFVNAGKFGHTKGLFAFVTAAAGFWLTHSIPLFPLGPTDSDNYRGLGSNAKTYAQNMLCVTIGITALNDLAKLFLLNRPQIYDSRLLNNNTEYIKQLIDGKYSTVKQCESDIIKTIANLSIKIYAKTAEWNNDLYAGCVTPAEQDTLLVESWIRGKAEGPVCPISDYNTLDIHYLSFVVGISIDSRGIDSRSSGIDSRWSETQDHSKWAITETKEVVCMGDINRMTSQYSRGGGTACFLDPVLHAVLKQATIKTNTCV